MTNRFWHFQGKSTELGSAYTAGMCDERTRIFEATKDLKMPEDVRQNLLIALRCIHYGTCGTWSAGECPPCEATRKARQT